METVKLSSKFQLVIPRTVRDRLGLSAGDRFQVITLGDRIQLVRVGHIHEVRGFLGDLDPNFERDEEDRT
mgnify:CR=1 FL=1